MTERPEADRVECPICSGRGTTRGRSFSRLRDSRHVCGLCEGVGSVPRAQIRHLVRLRTQMQRVADLMQSGDADAAARASQEAFRTAALMLDSGTTR